MKFNILILFFFCISCVPHNTKLDSRKPYNSTGFAYIYNDFDYEKVNIRKKFNTNYGMAVTGQVEQKNVVKNNSAKEGDLLVLTKPLGIGIISTGIKKGIVNKEVYKEAVKIMTHLNDGAKTAMNIANANACTDITGYGLLGHLLEICLGSNLCAEIKYKDIPFIQSTNNLAQGGIVPGGSKKNLSYVSDKVGFSDNLLEYQKLMIADAQTSGGLLITISEEKVNHLIDELKNQFFPIHL